MAKFVQNPGIQGHDAAQGSLRTGNEPIRIHRGDIRATENGTPMLEGCDTGTPSSALENLHGYPYREFESPPLRHGPLILNVLLAFLISSLQIGIQP